MGKEEKLKLLAEAPHPSMPTPYELSMLELKAEEEKRVRTSLVKVQTMVRVCLARARVRRIKARKEIGRKHWPLSGKLWLRLNDVENPYKLDTVPKLDETNDERRRRYLENQQRIREFRHEMILGEDTEQRKARQITKIQAAARGFLVRKKIWPVVET